MESYWARQSSMAIRTLDHVKIDSWFDLWHTHIDWMCKGNRFIEQRRRAATLTYEIYGYALAKAGSRTAPIQIWAHFFQNTGDNAVYIHTENANGTRFPYVFEDTEWEVAKSPELEHIAFADNLELGRMQFQGEISYVLRERA